MDIQQQGFADWKEAFLSGLTGAAAAFERNDQQLLERADKLAVYAAQLMAQRRAQGIAAGVSMAQASPQQIGGVPVPPGMAPVAVHYAPAGAPVPAPPPAHFGGGPLMGPQTSPPPMQPMVPPAPPPPPMPGASPPIMPIRQPGQ